MKVIIMTDLEGVAGVVSFEPQSYPTGKYNEEAKHLLTAEVNAAVDGLLEEDVRQVLVYDGHGSGGIVFEELHPAAYLMHGRPSAPAAVRDPIVAGYDATMIIGQHAMASVAQGDQNHTQSSQTIDYIKLNGQEIGEIAQWALYCGAMGVPLIFLSGDEAACREAEDLVPGITTAAVKQGLGRNSAISMSAQMARNLIRHHVQLAVQRQKEAPLPPLRWNGPYVLEKRFFHTDVADMAADRPGVERVDSRTVRIYSDDLLSLIYR